MLAAPAGAAQTTCEELSDGVEYRAFLPDQNRYIYADIKALPGVFPSIFVIVDKNYLSGAGANDPANKWWLDRSRPMQFSTDKVKISWPKESGIYAVAGWFGSADPTEITQPIRGLAKSPTGFEGKGSRDTNGFAFQTRLEMPGFTGEEFTVALPQISFDGVTLTPPLVRFTKDDKTATAKCAP
ncbi:hypothetical protein FHS83_003720 [Rhizomicrobium palustre]|uniref:Uncharacterized protein n=1 Tax=Rhizomicrobium palustre TaxID=189966 RepID=A0A846N5F2_9PROT|nr:hypothetical protein [Rhizomicrobium palustre]NIK90402.1 hypothetical protein [Rhizomicrobium palustre]